MTLTPGKIAIIERLIAAGNTSNEAVAEELGVLMDKERQVIAAKLAERAEDLVTGKDETCFGPALAISANELNSIANWVLLRSSR